MSHPVGSASPRAQIFACILCPVPLFVTSIRILYHFFDDIMPTKGVFVHEPAVDPLIVPQNGGGTVPPHKDTNK
jgi:hypothetical protein